jgi:putative transcriptional regulator
VEGVVLQQRRVDDGGVGLGDVGLVLAAGDEQRRQAVGGVGADAAGRGLDVVVATTDLGGRVTNALRDTGLAYEVDDV